MQSRSEIVLIGPIGSGKSTQGSLIAEACQIPVVSLDAIQMKHFQENGWCQTEFERTLKTYGPLAAYQYRWPYFAFAAERVLEEHSNCVFDFGAGHSHYADDRLLGRVKRAMAPFVNVILLLPSPDLDLSVKLLRERNLERNNDDCIEDGYDFMEHWVKDDSNHSLATLTVYTDGKTPEQTRDEILQSVA